ncbi:aminopeptidase P family protein [Candidatus Bipolaricaulota bacterium]|nr:aminopeptidase P family protein [Candidatus Bipolaricaulota bacterium]
MAVRISDGEIARRRKTLEEELGIKGIAGVCLFAPHNIFYLSRFSFIATERPIALVWTFGRRPVLFVPLLEREHAGEACEAEVVTYPEYPDERHPMRLLGDLLRELGLEGKRIGVDSNGYAGGYGYRGPKLSEVISVEVVEVAETLERMMWVKSPEEIELLRESAKWANLAHSLLQEYTRPGCTETEISARASYEASAAMFRALGPDYHPTKPGLPAYAGFRGQVGPGSAVPHAITTNARIKRGDVLVTGATADVGGYWAELERTMIVGRPTEEQRRYFELMLAAQELAFSQIKPGRRCRDVDRAVRAFFAKEGIQGYWLHHTGHALGIRMHESPFFDIGDDTVIEPGMVFSVEPGIYIPGFAGFRHSDTVVVTEDGIELLTHYPRDLADLTIN